jgi:methylated-DNA-[protein]-cysteine S-methyltransferase
LREFQLPLDIEGTEFQKRVWGQVAAIPYGETRSYLQISKALGSPGAVRAVGAANGANPVPIVVPCHRVIGAKGSLVGYGGGLALKKRLLELEGAIALPLEL